MQRLKLASSIQTLYILSDLDVVCLFVNVSVSVVFVC